MQSNEPARCTRCGAPFHCGFDDPAGCWCARLPPLPANALAPAAGCLCRACLERTLADLPEAMRAVPLNRP
jgi:hypothetical protein